MSLLTAVRVPDVFEPSRACKQTMHMGFARSGEYGIVPDGLPSPGRREHWPCCFR